MEMQKYNIRGTEINKIQFSEIESYLEDKGININATFDMISDEKEFVYVSNGFVKGLTAEVTESGEWHHFFKKNILMVTLSPENFNFKITNMPNETHLHELKERLPELHYEGGAFYINNDVNDSLYDQFICIPGTSENIDADQVIIEFFRWYEGNPDIDSNWVKDIYGSFENAYKNTL